MIYLDNAATTYPLPYETVKGITKALDKFGANPGRGGYEMSVLSGAAVYDCREKAAKMFGLDSPERVVFTPGCTYSLNFVIKAHFKPGCNMVCSSLEHNAVMRPMYALSQKGADIRVAKVSFANEEETLSSFERLIDQNTTLVVCTHASNVCGFILPIEKLGKLCRKKKVPFCVDAAQSAGILDVNMQKMKIDFLCIPGHKGLYGPMGVGLMLCGGDIKNTVIEGGTGNMSLSFLQPDSLPERFESGTLNVPGIVGLSGGMDFVLKHRADIYPREHRLMKMCYNGLSAMGNVRLYTDGFDERYVPLISFNIKGMQAEKTAYRLGERGICVRAGLHCAPSAHRVIGSIDSGTVRVCPSAFTKTSDISSFLRAVNAIASGR